MANVCVCVCVILLRQLSIDNLYKTIKLRSAVTFFLYLISSLLKKKLSKRAGLPIRKQ